MITINYGHLCEIHLVPLISRQSLTVVKCAKKSHDTMIRTIAVPSAPLFRGDGWHAFLDDIVTSFI